MRLDAEIVRDLVTGVAGCSLSVWLLWTLRKGPTALPVLRSFGSNYTAQRKAFWAFVIALVLVLVTGVALMALVVLGLLGFHGSAPPSN